HYKCFFFVRYKSKVHRMKKPQSALAQCLHVLFFCASFFLLPFVTKAQTPLNDNCSNAQLITSDATCIPTSGTLYNAAATAGIPTACGSNSTTTADVW